MTAFQKSLMTWLKYAAWTGAAALIQYLINTIGNQHLPVWMVFIVASVLKSAATYVATKLKERG